MSHVSIAKEKQHLISTQITSPISKLRSSLPQVTDISGFPNLGPQLTKSCVKIPKAEALDALAVRTAKRAHGRESTPLARAKRKWKEMSGWFTISTSQFLLWLRSVHKSFPQAVLHQFCCFTFQAACLPGANFKSEPRSKVAHNRKNCSSKRTNRFTLRKTGANRLHATCDLSFVVNAIIERNPYMEALPQHGRISFIMSWRHTKQEGALRDSKQQTGLVLESHK